MKKCLLFAMVVASACALSACAEHQHAYSDEWSKDGDYHWHVCQADGCGEPSQKEAHSYDVSVSLDGERHERSCVCGAKIEEDHTWDEGELTKIPSAGENGEKTFTCTVCGQTKTEEAVYVPDYQVSPQEWIDSFDATRLNNVTLEGSIWENDYGDIPMLIQCADGDSYESMTYISGRSHESYYEQTETGVTRYSKYSNQTTWNVEQNSDFYYNGQVLLSLLPLDEKYAEFTYDEETHCYEAGELECVSIFGVQLHYDSVWLRFEDGMVTWIHAIMATPFQMTADSVEIAAYEFTFTNYGSTSIDFSVCKPRSTVASESEWKSAFNLATSACVDKRIGILYTDGDSVVNEAWIAISNGYYSEWYRDRGGKPPCLTERIFVQTEVGCMIYLRESPNWEEIGDPISDEWENLCVSGQWSDYTDEITAFLKEGIVGEDCYAVIFYNDELECYEFTTTGMGYGPNATVSLRFWVEDGLLVREWMKVTEGAQTLMEATIEIEYLTTTVANPAWGLMFDSEIYDEEQWTQAIETATRLQKDMRMTATMRRSETLSAGLEATLSGNVFYYKNTGGYSRDDYCLIQNGETLDEYYLNEDFEWEKKTEYGDWETFVDSWQTLINGTHAFAVPFDEWEYNEETMCYEYVTEIDGIEGRFYMKFCDGVLSYAWAEYEREGDVSRIEMSFEYHGFTIGLPDFDGEGGDPTVMPDTDDGADGPPDLEEDGGEEAVPDEEPHEGDGEESTPSE